MLLIIKHITEMPLGLLHFVAFFHVASIFSTGVKNKKVVLEKKKPKSRSNELYVNLFFDAVQPNVRTYG